MKLTNLKKKNINREAFVVYLVKIKMQDELMNI